MARATRKRIYGTDLFREITSPDSTVSFEASYWDLWFVVVLQNEFGGDWGQMASHFRESRSPLTSYRSERMLNHQVHLQERLSEAGLSVEELLGDVALLKSEKRRAKKKILEQTPNRSEMSHWMQHTPREELEARAMRGYWSHFPVSPGQYEPQVQRLFKKTLYRKGQTSALESKLEKFVVRNTKKAPLERTVALHRVFLTVLVERMDQIDDSYGTIGYFYDELFERYIALPRELLDMEPEYFWHDFMGLIIWEDYGMTDSLQPKVFESLHPSEVSLVQDVLREQIDDLFAHEITYQAEEALTMLGLLCTEQKKFDEFVPLATQMGTRAWKRIMSMSEIAEKNQRPELALAVYEAALGPGRHERSLREEYEKLKKRVGSS